MAIPEQGASILLPKNSCRVFDHTYPNARLDSDRYNQQVI